MVDVSDGAMSRILGEQEAPPAVAFQRRRRKRPIRRVDVSATGFSKVGTSLPSTPVKSFSPIYSQRRSSLLEFPAEFDVDDLKRRVVFDIGDDDTPTAKLSLIADVMRPEGRNVPELGYLGLSDIESLALPLAGQAKIPAVGVAV